MSDRLSDEEIDAFYDYCALCPEAAEVVKRCLKSEDDKIALAAAQIAFERGYGRPEMHADVDVNYRFVIAPQTMGLDEWLACKGQPAPNRWLERQAQPKASTQAQDTKLDFGQF
jgi:hypothetical protein